MNRDLTKGPVMRAMLLFAVPMILGNLLQQCYNIADTMIVGKCLGKNALAAVGSAFALMTFITSIFLGLCMGSGAVFSIRFGQRDEEGLKESVSASFFLIAALTVLLNVLSFACLDQIQVFLRVSAILNIALDFLFVMGLKRGAAGAAEATVISQYVSGLGIMAYALARYPRILAGFRHFHISWDCIKEISSFSFLTCIQQSVMNLGILMVQGLVNSFGPVVMAAFAAAVKIDAFAYMPVQDFGNAFSTFIAQNYGAKKEERIRAGVKGAALAAVIFSVAVSAGVWIFAGQLMELFIAE